MLKVYDEIAIDIKRPDHAIFSPDSRRITHLRSVFRRSFIASHRSRSAQRYLRSHASIDYEKRRHSRHHIYIIHPFSIFR